MAELPVNRPPSDIQLGREIDKVESYAAIWFAKGRHALAVGQNVAARVAFTFGLIHIPQNSKNIVDYYLHRSEALQRSRLFVESIQDIETARQLPVCPVERKDNLLKQKQALEQRYANILNLRAGPNEERTLFHGENQEVKGVSKAVILQYSEKFGRHYVAKRDIKVGDVLMIQKPFVSVPIKDAKFYNLTDENQWICDYCADLTEAPIPCDNCTFSVYCCRECQSNAQKKYHKIECKVLKFTSLAERQTSLCFRAMLVVTEQGEKFHDVPTILRSIQNARDRRTVGFKDGKFDGCTPDAALSLMTYSDEKMAEVTEAEADFLADTLKRNTNILEQNNIDDDGQMKQILLQLNKICLKNTATTRQGHAKNVVATIICPAFHLVNHSCDCNTIAYDEGGNKILRACKNIKKGEQIYVSYVSESLQLNLENDERRALLNMCYNFTCECQWCENEHYFQKMLTRPFLGARDIRDVLINKPNDTDTLWKFLRMVLSQYHYPYYGTKVIQYGLVNAYAGGDNRDFLTMINETGLFI